MRFKLIIGVIAINSFSAWAQIDAAQNLLIDYEWHEQQSQAPIAHKIELNDLEALKNLCPELLSLEQIQAIYWHCQTYGPLLMLQELQSIPICQSINFKRLAQFIESDPLLFPKTKPNTLSFCSAFPMQTTAGFNNKDSTRFLGSNQKHQLSFRYHYKQFSCYLQSEKDPGEPWQYSSSFGCLTFKNRTFSFCLGDQHIVFGQGLVVGSKKPFYNSLNFQIIQHNNELKPKTDFAENGSIRGLGITLFKDRKCRIQGFYGSYLLDQTNPSQLGNCLYRNATEHSLKFKASQAIWGLSIQTRIRKCQLDCNWNEQLSLSAKSAVKSWYCFGEITLLKQARDYYIGAIRSFGKTFSLAWSIRQNNSIGSQNTMRSNYTVFEQASNEYNIITQCVFNKRLQVNAQFCVGKAIEQAIIDRFTKYYQFNLNYQFNKQDKLTMVLNGKQDNLFGQLNFGQKNSLKLSLSHEKQTIKLLSQCLIKSANGSSKNAYLLSESLQIQCNKNIHLSLLGAVFNNFEQGLGLSLYEHNIPGQQTLFTYYHKGFHWHIMLQTKCLKDLNIWIRFAATSYAQSHDFGSGLDRFTGNYKSTLNTGIKWAL
ncbi:MAG: hypothetical protein RLZZ318_442 [Bacteroidota bacterium]